MGYILIELMKKLRGLYKTLSRKKVVNTTQDTPLARVLSTVDLIALGVGSTWQYFAYFMMTIYGTRLSFTISITIAAIISMFTGLCYAEFSARMPRAGSAYIYSYVTMGEFVGFFTGWTIILKYMMDSAVTVRILSYFINAVFYAIEEFFETRVPIKIKNLLSSLSLSFPNIIAFVLTLIFSAVLALGTKTSCVLNNILILLKLSINIIIFLIISSKADFDCLKRDSYITFSNKTITLPNDTYDITHIIDGTILFSITFIGFDCITTMGEEVKNPQQSIPRAIITSITFVFFVYFGIFVAFICFQFYSLSTLLDTWVRWILIIEIISGFCTSLLGPKLSLPRVINAMASDGLIFKSLGHVNPRFQTRIISTLIDGIRSGILALIFDTDSLNNVRYVCAMVLYSIVALCVIIVRYEENESCRKQDESSNKPQTFIFIMKQFVNANKLKRPTKLTMQIVNVLLCCYVILCICTISLLSLSEFKKGEANYVMLIILTIALVIILCFIYFQPVSDKKRTFSVPLVPFLPGLSIFLNFYIIKIFLPLIWIGFFLWMAVGLGVYFLYGMWHSNIRHREPPSESNNDDRDENAALSLDIVN